MGILVVFLSISMIFIWISLREAKQKIKQLDDQHAEIRSRLEALARDDVTIDITEVSDELLLQNHSPVVSSPAQKSLVRIDNIVSKYPAIDITNMPYDRNDGGENKDKSNDKVEKLTTPALYTRAATQTNKVTSSTTQAQKQAPKTQPPKTKTPTEPHQPKTPNLFDNGVAYVKDWLTTGNIPVKIGILVLFSAVIAFLRYATAQGWLQIPMEYRLIGVSCVALGALAFAWTKRETKRSFSLSVQGGSIGMLLLVIFSAVKMYGFITPTVGFLLSVMAVLLATVLALKQDAKALIVMAIFAGFLAPIWLSDGTGSHVVLFTYYAILNVGIFIVSWYKPWRELNLLGFIFTYVIGSMWGGLQYKPAHFASTEPFVLLFFLFYLLIPLRSVQTTVQDNSSVDKHISASLLFGAPLVTLGLQVGMLYDNSTWLAYSCVGMGLVYGVLAWLLRGRKSYATLRQAYLGLSAGFLTLAVPIGLSARATSAIFALEGAGAVWLGCRTRRMLTWLSGILLQITSAIAFALAYIGYQYFTERPFLLNDWYFSALLIIIGAVGCLWACYHYAQCGLVEAQSSLDTWLNETLLMIASNTLFMWGFVWWLFANVSEILRVSAIKVDIFLFTTITAALLVVVYRYFSQAIVVCVQAGLMLIGGLFATVGVFEALTNWHTGIVYPLSSWGVTVWCVYGVFGWMIWRMMREVEGVFTDVAVTTWILSLATVTSLAVYQMLPTAWHMELSAWAISVVWLVLMAMILLKPRWLTGFAVRPTRDWHVWTSYGVLVVIVTLCSWVMQLSGGERAWWLPIANSVDLLLLAMVGLIMAWVMRYEPHVLGSLSYLVSALVIGSVTLRMMHHWGGFSPWRGQLSGNWNDWLQLAMFGFWIVVLWGLRLLSPAPADASNGAKKWLQTIVPAVIDCLMLLLVGAWFVLLFDGGNVTPLPWLPVLNPLFLLQWTILGLAWRWLRQNGEKLPIPYQSMMIPVCGLVLISVMTLRFVHHWGQIDWSPVMLKFALTQMALTLVWSVLGVVAWIAGSRRASRPLWLMGAVLMSVVLIKLVLVDRGHLGNLFGIVSFFAYGLLCVVVGYFAPMPPSEEERTR